MLRLEKSARAPENTALKGPELENLCNDRDYSSDTAFIDGFKHFSTIAMELGLQCLTHKVELMSVNFYGYILIEHRNRDHNSSGLISVRCKQQRPGFLHSTLF